MYAIREQHGKHEYSNLSNGPPITEDIFQHTHAYVYTSHFNTIQYKCHYGILSNFIRQSTTILCKTRSVIRITSYNQFLKKKWYNGLRLWRQQWQLLVKIILLLLQKFKNETGIMTNYIFTINNRYPYLI